MVLPSPGGDEIPAREARRLFPTLSALLSGVRPKQWVKNLLVFAAPGAAGVLSHMHAVLESLGCFGVFCVTASGVYLLNDAIDAEADRHHPDKSRRPVASGRLSPVTATATGLFLLIIGTLASFAVAGWQLALTVGVYSVVNISYCLWLKSEPVIDLVAVASGFVLRTIAGGVATHVPLSDWFLIVASFGSLFIVAGKRHAEHVGLGDAREDHRAALGQYSLSYLRFVRAVAAGTTLLAYCLWAFDKADHAATAGIWFRLSIVPITVGVLRYALLLDLGHGGAPEDVLFADRRLQLTGVVWTALFVLAIYAPR